MSNKHAELLQDIVQVARDGADFYDTASSHVKSSALKDTFARMASAKRLLISALGGRLDMIGEEIPQSGTLAGSARKAYTELRAALSSQEDVVYVSQLEQAEDRLLAEVEGAVEKAENSEIRSQLLAHLPAVRSAHDEMRRLKQQMAA
jgi:uncharacterized protein (TIGR02284 family)